MSDRLKRPIALAIGLAMLVALSATPVMGQSGDDVRVAAASGNASKVDGKSAVGANASVAARAGKLVATNNQGLLPSDILNPLWSLLQGIPAAFADGQITWAEITGKPAGFADDVDNGAFVSNVGAAFAIGPGATLYPSVYSLNRNISIEFEIVPDSPGVFLTEIDLGLRERGYHREPFRRGHESGCGTPPSGSDQLYSDGIAPAALKKQAKKVEIQVLKKLPH